MLALSFTESSLSKYSVKHLGCSNQWAELVSCSSIACMWCVCCVLVVQSCQTLCNPTDCSPTGSSVHGILEERILKRLAVPSSRGSSRPRDRTLVSCTAGRFFTVWATGVVNINRRILGYMKCSEENHIGWCDRNEWRAWDSDRVAGLVLLAKEYSCSMMRSQQWYDIRKEQFSQKQQWREMPGARNELGVFQKERRPEWLEQKGQEMRGLEERNKESEFFKFW